eukprot:6273546-Pyramimonas_sp.AAC.1
MHGAWAPLVSEAARSAGIDNLGAVRLRVAQDFCEGARAARRRTRANYHANRRRLAQPDAQ